MRTLFLSQGDFYATAYFPIFRYGVLPLIPLVLIIVISGLFVAIHPASSISSRILTIIGILFAVAALATPFLFLSIH
jgi:hypothetical protein